MNATDRFTFKIIETHFGPAIVRVDANGYELIWEICKRGTAVRRLAHHQAIEEQVRVRTAA